MDQFLRRHGELIDLLGADAKKALPSPQAFRNYLRERFRWKTVPMVGDVVSDLVLVEAETGNVINLDWTASTNLDRF
jgi:hypothetical protein